MTRERHSALEGNALQAREGRRDPKGPLRVEMSPERRRTVCVQLCAVPQNADLETAGRSAVAGGWGEGGVDRAQGTLRAAKLFCAYEWVHELIELNTGGEPQWKLQIWG